MIAESGSLARSSLTASFMVLIFVIKIPPFLVEIWGEWTICLTALFTQKVSPVRETEASLVPGLDKFSPQGTANL